MNWKVILSIIIVLLLVGAAVVDAKGKSGGGKSGSSSKSFFSKTASESDGVSSKATGIATIPALAKSTKKKTHLDDDLFENETEEELEEQQSPGPGVLPAFLAMGLLFMAWRRGKAR